VEQPDHAVATKSTALIPSAKRAGDSVSASSPSYSRLIGASLSRMIVSARATSSLGPSRKSPP
jgi:hypothetical protein